METKNKVFKIFPRKYEDPEGYLSAYLTKEDKEIYNAVFVNEKTGKILDQLPLPREWYDIYRADRRIPKNTNFIRYCGNDTWEFKGPNGKISRITNKKNYGKRITISKNKVINLYIHNILMILFKATPGDYKEKNLTVDHIDRDEYNFSLSNLRWADKSMQNENRNEADANRIYYSIQHKKAFELKDLSKLEKDRIQRAARRGWKSKIDSLPNACNWKILDKNLFNIHGAEYLINLESDKNWVKSNYSLDNRPIYVHKDLGYFKIRNNFITKGSKQKNRNWKDPNGKNIYDYKFEGVIDNVSGKKYKFLLAHRLIHKVINDPSFNLDNPDIKIDHRNSNHEDNRPENLQACTTADNNRNPNSVAKRYKPVIQFSKDGKRIIAIFPSIKDAQIILSVEKSSISRCCSGKQKSYKGYIWKYEDDFLNNYIPELKKTDPKLVEDLMKQYEALKRKP